MSIPPPREASRATHDGIIISKYPDVCRSPTAPVPYCIIAYQDDDANTASSVFMTGQRAHKQNSIVTKCMGDEPGTGLGVKSNTVSSICHRKGHSNNVRIEGQWATRDSDEWWMNNKNTIGKLVWPKHQKSFDPTPPFKEYEKPTNSASDEGRVLSDAMPEPLVMGAEYAQALPAETPQYGGGTNTSPTSSGATNPTPSNEQTSKNYPNAANDNKPGRQNRWWKLVQNVWQFARSASNSSGLGLGANAFGNAYGGAAALGLSHYQSTAKNAMRRDMGLAPRTTTPFGSGTYELEPLTAKKPEEEDHSPVAHGRTQQGLSIKEKEEEERKKRCRVLPYKALEGTCQPNEQAHHIVPDYTLRYGSRPEGAKGYKRIGDAGGDLAKRATSPFPSFWMGPAICLLGNARDDGTEHFEAHGADKVIESVGAKPGDINPIGTARIGDIKEMAALHTGNARPECRREIFEAVKAAFPDEYDNRLARTTQSLPTGDALEWLKEGASMTRH